MEAVPIGSKVTFFSNRCNLPIIFLKDLKSEKKFKKNKAAVVELESKHEEDDTTLQNTINTEVMFISLLTCILSV